MATEIQSQDEEQQETESIHQATVEETVPPEPTFQSMWNDITGGLTDEIVRLYREAGMPPMKVWSKQKGNVHYRTDIHQGGRGGQCRERGCSGWQSARQPKPKVIKSPPIEAEQAQDNEPKQDEPTASDGQGETELEPVPQETMDQSE
jgi:hypothetical protein